MANFNLTVQDAELRRQLGALIDRLDKPAQVLKPIGEQIVERIKQRFQTSTDPDGTLWQPNAPSTLRAIANGLGKGYRTKSGGLNARGALKISSKKPLIGATGNLSEQIHAQVIGDSLTITESMGYAAIHQFGGKAGAGRKVTIPARPSAPFKIDGTIYPQEQALLLQAINDYLADAMT